jgi:hypothetical protein
MSLSELCAEVRNYFIKSTSDIHNGKFTIEGGKIAPLDFLQKNQYFRIVGSVFNDGVYKNDEELNLTDEVFEGAVWSMSLPPDFIDLCTEIEEYKKSDMAKPSPYTSESFGGYSYSKATDSNGVPLDWKKVFASRLNRYRRISVL